MDVQEQYNETVANNGSTRDLLVQNAIYAFCSISKLADKVS